MKKKVRNPENPKRRSEDLSLRIQKIIAEAGLCSRRGAEEAIRRGRVSVNGATVTEPGSRATPGKDLIVFDGNPVIPQGKRYIILNKPAGTVCTMHDPEGRRTVSELVRGIPERVKPVGRLDYNTTGLLLLTNDGDFAQAMMHPSSGIIRRYQAKVRGEVSAASIDKMLKGLSVEGVRYRFLDVSVSRKSGGNTFISISLAEGKKHHVKKLCAAAGNTVIKLARVGYGPLKLSGLGPGDYRHLSGDEVRGLLAAARSKTPHIKHTPRPRRAVRMGKGSKKNAKQGKKLRSRS